MNDVNENACWQHLEQVRWPSSIVCPLCGSTGKMYPFANHGYKCAGCRRQFNVLKGTIFERTRVPLGFWFVAIFETIPKKRASSRQLADLLGVTQQTAYGMQMKILGARPNILMSCDILDKTTKSKPDFFWRPAYGPPQIGSTPADRYTFTITMPSQTVALDLVNAINVMAEIKSYDSDLSSLLEAAMGIRPAKKDYYHNPIILNFQGNWEQTGRFASVLGNGKMPPHLRIIGNHIRLQVYQLDRLPDHYRWYAYLRLGLSYEAMSAYFGANKRTVGRLLKSSGMRLASRHTFMGDMQSMFSFAVPGITTRTMARRDKEAFIEAFVFDGMRRWFLDDYKTDSE